MASGHPPSLRPQLEQRQEGPPGHQSWERLALRPLGSSDLMMVRGDTDVLRHKLSCPHPYPWMLKQLTASEMQAQCTKTWETAEKGEIGADRARSPALGATQGAGSSDSPASRHCPGA